MAPYVAGGSTGFIMKDLRGKHADYTVYRIDPGWIDSHRRIYVRDCGGPQG